MQSASIIFTIFFLSNFVHFLIFSSKEEMYWSDNVAHGDGDSSRQTVTHFFKKSRLLRIRNTSYILLLVMIKILTLETRHRFPIVSWCIAPSQWNRKTHGFVFTVTLRFVSFPSVVSSLWVICVQKNLLLLSFLV